MAQSLVGIHSTHRQCYFKRCNSPTPALETAVPISVLLWDAVGAGAARHVPLPVLRTSPAWRAFPCSSLYYRGNANTAEKITSFFLREKTKKEKLGG